MDSYVFDQNYASPSRSPSQGPPSPQKQEEETPLIFTIPVVYCWGNNVQGQCATSDIDDGTNNYSAPAPLVPNAAHDNGADLHGPQVALVSERAQNLTTPQMVKFFLDKPPIKLITTGGNHSLALLEDGSLYAWGANTDGQLGLGHTRPVVQPTELTFFKERNEQIQALYSGYNYSLVLTESGALYSFGYNNFGQLGLQFISLRVETPHLVSFFSNKSIKIKEVATGGNHCLLLTQEGAVYAWGYNKYGQLGLGNNINYDTPQLITFFDASRPVMAVSAGQRHSVVLCRSHEVYTFGHNFYGALGLGHFSDTSTPQLVKFFAGMKIVQVIAGGYHTIFIDDAGHLYSTGYNMTGELGLGTQENTNIPKNIEFFNDKKIASIAVGSQHTLVLLENQEIYSWGYNKFGQLGLGHAHPQHSPKLVEFFKDKTISRIYGGYRHTLLVTGAYRPKLGALQKAMLRLLETHMFSDVTLTVGGATFYLHKTVLFARAPQLLQVALQWQSNDTAMDTMDDDIAELARFLQSKPISTRAFQLLLEYVYAEQLPPYKTDFNTFVHLSVCASLLKLHQLERVAYFHLTGLINSSNVFDVLKTSIELESEVLKSYALHFIAYNKSLFPTSKLRALIKDKFDTEIVWQIMALMDEGPKPPAFPMLSDAFRPEASKLHLASAFGGLKSSLSTNLARLLDDPQRAAEMGVTMDLQLEVEGHVINAHRCILAAQSEWFAAALSSRMKEAHTGVVRIVGSSSVHNVTYSAMQALVRYLYTGTFTHITSEHDALQILANADYFLLTSGSDDSGDHAALLRHCEEIILKPMNVHNAPELLVQIDKLGPTVSHLRDRVMSWIIEHYQEVATISTRLLDIPERLFREIQIQFNLHLLRLIAGNGSSSVAAALAHHAVVSDAGPAK